MLTLIYYQNKPIAETIKSKLKIAEYFLFCMTLLLVFTGTTFSSFTHPLYASMFALLLFLFTTTNTKISLLNHPYIVYMGKISYGVYMLHPVVIVIALKLFYIDTGNAVLNVVLFDLITVALVIALSIVSYNFFERFFLKMRK